MLAETPVPDASRTANLKAAILEVLDALGGTVSADRATAIGTLLWKEGLLQHASPGRSSDRLWPGGADLLSGAVFAVAEAGLLRRESGSLALTAAGRRAVEGQDARAGDRARMVAAELMGLPRYELRVRATQA